MRTLEPTAAVARKSTPDKGIADAFIDQSPARDYQQITTSNATTTAAVVSNPPTLFAELIKRLGSNVWMGSIDTTLTTAWQICDGNRLVINPALLTPALLAGLTNHGGVFLTVAEKSAEGRTILALLGQRAILVPGYGYFVTPAGVAPGSLEYAVLKANVLEAAFQVKSNSPLAQLLAATYLSSLRDDKNAIRVLQTMSPSDQGRAYCIAAHDETDPALKQKFIEEAIKSNWKLYISKNSREKCSGSYGIALAYREKSDSDNELKYLKECYYASLTPNPDKQYQYADIIMARLFSFGRYNEAKEWYSQVNDPSRLVIYRAKLYEIEGDVNNAIFTAGKAPQTIDNLLYLGSLYKKTQNTRDAEWTLGRINQQLSKLPSAEQARIKNSADYKKLMQ